MAATIAAQEARIAALAAQLAALTAQIARLQRDLYGARSERRGDGADGFDDTEGADGRDRRRGGRPGRRKDRGDAVNDTGLRFNGEAPVIDITVTPPEIEGLSEDDYELVSERVHCRLAGPVLDRLFAAWDEVEATDNHAQRHATIYRHFVAEFPRLRVHLAAEVESSAEAVVWARKAIFCLTRDQTTE